MRKRVGLTLLLACASERPSMVERLDETGPGRFRYVSTATMLHPAKSPQAEQKHAAPEQAARRARHGRQRVGRARLPPKRRRPPHRGSKAAKSVKERNLSVRSMTTLRRGCLRQPYNAKKCHSSKRGRNIQERLKTQFAMEPSSTDIDLHVLVGSSR
jgi:hypothetical protein